MKRFIILIAAIASTCGIIAQQFTALHNDDPLITSGISPMGQDTIFFDHSNEEPEPTPICIIPKYREIIKPLKLKSNFVTPSYNNDSLYWEYNKDIDQNSSGHIGGFDENFPDDTWFKQHAHKFELDTGTVWIYKATTITGVGVVIYTKTLDIPADAQLSILFRNPEELDYVIHGTGDVHMDFNKSTMRTFNGTELYIEYFEPKGTGQSYDFELTGWGYDFSYIKKTLSKELKAGSHGTAVANDSCYNDINCPNTSFNHWRDLNKRVCYIKQEYEYTHNGTTKRAFVSGSGVFINKSGSGYTQDNKPYILTCKHIFYFEIPETGQWIDLLNPSTGNATPIGMYINYKNDVCNSTKVFKGDWIGNFNVIKTGNSYDSNDPNYKHSEDYALLESTRKMKNFAKYGVTFSAWRQYIQLNSPPGVASFGHPRGDVMKICLDEDDTVRPPGMDYIPIYYEFGIGEDGMSGGPVFNYHKDLIGTVVTKSPGGTCGDNTTRSSAGNFEKIYPNIKQYIDPTNQTYSVDKIYASLTPAECRNCTQDLALGETGMDCGGDCMPCYVPTYGFMSNRHEFIQSDKLSATHSMSVSLDEEIRLKSVHKQYSAGDVIILSRNVVFEPGSSLIAEINPELSVSDVQRTRDVSCVYVTNVITPNGDGKNDYMYMRQKGVIDYQILVYDRYGKKKYDSGHQSVFTDGVIAIYDGKGLRTGAYYATVHYWDTNNNKQTRSLALNIL